MTYSIVAHDSATGALGIAVQSHWFNVGALVPAALAGVGAVATQANPDVQHKPRALAMLRAGTPPERVVAALLEGDPAAAHRQLAVVDAAGRAAAHTGDACIAAAGSITGDGFVVQANMMRGPAVWPAMAETFEATRSSGLQTALLATLDAAEAAGGDLRGRQSAAILVVPSSGTEADVLVDLRVDDSPDPLAELRRLARVNDAYLQADAGDAAMAHGDFTGAAERYVAAYRAAPGNTELRFWAGLGLVAAGDEPQGLALVEEAIDADASWLVLLGRLDAAVVPSAPAVLALLRG